MILGALIVGAVIGAIVVKFWREIAGWFQKAFQKVKEILHVAVVGSEVFLKKMQEGFKEVSYHYSKQNGRWRKDTVVKQETVALEDVPEEFRLAAQNAGIAQEIDISAELQLQLEAASK